MTHDTVAGSPLPLLAPSLVLACSQHPFHLLIDQQASDVICVLRALRMPPSLAALHTGGSL